MNPFRDALSILIESARLLGKTSPAMLALVMLGAIILAGLAWWGAVNYTKLWNLRFTPNALHHAMCAFAAAFTLIFTIGFASLGFAKQVATRRIDAWNAAVVKDDPLITRSAKKAFYAVQKAGVETMDPATHYVTENGARYPAVHDETRRMVAQIYLDAAIADLRSKNPYLLKAIWKRTGIPYERVLEDRNRTSGNFKIERYFLLAGEELKKELAPQAPKVVGSARRWLVLLFLFAQAIPFSLIGWAAYRDLRERY